MADTAMKGRTTSSEGTRGYVPALGVDRLTSLYDPVIRLTTRERVFRRRLLDQARIAAGMTVLDVGCGTGTLAIQAKQRTPGAEVVGLDGDLKVLERARRKASAARAEVTFDQGLSGELPYPDGSFDRVLSSLLFHHLVRQDKLRTVAEIRRVLKPGGELHVADFGKPSGPVTKALSLSIRLLDGFENTRDNFAGELPALFERGGMERVALLGEMTLVYGTLAFYSAEKPSATKPVDVQSAAHAHPNQEQGGEAPVDAAPSTSVPRR